MTASGVGIKNPDFHFPKVIKIPPAALSLHGALQGSTTLARVRPQHVTRSEVNEFRIDFARLLRGSLTLKSHCYKLSELSLQRGVNLSDFKLLHEMMRWLATVCGSLSIARSTNQVQANMTWSDEIAIQLFLAILGICIGWGQRAHGDGFEPIDLKLNLPRLFLFLCSIYEDQTIRPLRQS